MPKQLVLDIRVSITRCKQRKMKRDPGVTNGIYSMRLKNRPPSSLQRSNSQINMRSSVECEFPWDRMLWNSCSKLNFFRCLSRARDTRWETAISFNWNLPAYHQILGSVKCGLFSCQTGKKSLTAVQKASDFNSCVLNFQTPRPRGL